MRSTAASKTSFYLLWGMPWKSCRNCFTLLRVNFREIHALRATWPWEVVKRFLKLFPTDWEHTRRNYTIECEFSHMYCRLQQSKPVAMATHSSTLAWRIPWTQEPGRVQSVGSLRVGHDWATSLHFTSPKAKVKKVLSCLLVCQRKLVLECPQETYHNSTLA